MSSSMSGCSTSGVRTHASALRWPTRCSFGALCRGRTSSTLQSVSVPQPRSSVAAAAWGDDVEFTPATIATTSSVTPLLQQITVSVTPDIAKSYTAGGQYVQMKVADSKAAFMAVASSPLQVDSTDMTFMIKDTGPESTAHLIAELEVGGELTISPAMGKGFLVDKVPASEFDTVLMFATGTGISPIKALIEGGTLDLLKRKDVRLYYGCTDEQSMPFADRIPEWEELGVKVIKVFSKSDAGYVQKVYEKDTPPADASKTCVFLCGQKDMCNDVKAVVTSQGVAEDKCLFNF